ncbi:Heat shock protein 16 [Grifola frondosa]|uniref:Heat shock protein 16 n=1 Tax=Grifola frondosa TaxID=5627 RepID=A0A1C7LWG6_GRIFR|nr:Heat shock protein 16 [Grifola frondosa]
MSLITSLFRDPLIPSFFNEPVTTAADRLFDDMFTGRLVDLNNRLATAGGTRPLMPRLDLHEDAEANTVTATFELPGLRKEDVQIDLNNHVLTVSGESKVSGERSEDGYTIRERRFGKFSRSLTLPAGVENDQVKASLENGLLNVTYPRSTPETTPQKITIS